MRRHWSTHLIRFGAVLTVVAIVLLLGVSPGRHLRSVIGQTYGPVVTTTPTVVDCDAGMTCRVLTVMLGRRT